MYAWVVRRIFALLSGRLNRGDIALIERTLAPDVVLSFPGDSSFAGEYRGKPAVVAWFRRFVALQPHYDLHDVTVAGPPWNMRIGVLFSDRIPLPGGGEYRNAGMEHLRMRWGRLEEVQVHLDTQKVAELDAQLEHAAVGAPVTS
jgi:ketosteroid isomerase-like protein